MEGAFGARLKLKSSRVWTAGSLSSAQEAWLHQRASADILQASFLEAWPRLESSP